VGAPGKVTHRTHVALVEQFWVENPSHRWANVLPSPYTKAISGINLMLTNEMQLPAGWPSRLERSSVTLLKYFTLVINPRLPAFHLNKLLVHEQTFQFDKLAKIFKQLDQSFPDLIQAFRFPGRLLPFFRRSHNCENSLKQFCKRLDGSEQITNLKLIKVFEPRRNCVQMLVKFIPSITLLDKDVRLRSHKKSW
jgi:hypothetical protein